MSAPRSAMSTVSRSWSWVQSAPTVRGWATPAALSLSSYPRSMRRGRQQVPWWGRFLPFRVLRETQTTPPQERWLHRMRSAVHGQRVHERLVVGLAVLLNSSYKLETSSRQLGGDTGGEFGASMCLVGVGRVLSC